MKVEHVWTLHEGWVLVSGIPTDALRDYLALWGLGSLFGKTEEVDMVYTRLHGVLRIRIACADFSRIPDRRVVLIKGEGYELSFQVEAPLGVQPPADEHLLDATDPEEDGGDFDGKPPNDRSNNSEKLPDVANSNTSTSATGNVVLPPSAQLVGLPGSEICFGSFPAGAFSLWVLF